MPTKPHPADFTSTNDEHQPSDTLDQIRACQAMRDKGHSVEEIAVAFGVSTGLVKSWLKLSAVAPSLLQAYSQQKMTTQQLAAFTVNPDQDRQVQVWEALNKQNSQRPDAIREMLMGTETSARAMAAPGDTYLSMNRLIGKLGGRSRSAIYLDLKAGRLPQPIKLGGKVYWIEREVDEHLRQLRDHVEP
jgi:predicted DNA-binding transcriptional regulator AlpA/transposase-like protein